MSPSQLSEHRPNAGMDASQRSALMLGGAVCLHVTPAVREHRAACGACGAHHRLCWLQVLQRAAAVPLLQRWCAVQVSSALLPQDLLDALPDYTLAFEADGDDGHSAYYYCDRSRELSEEFGDLLYKIQDLEVTGGRCSEPVIQVPGCGRAACAHR
jgi:hypothetical protein